MKLETKELKELADVAIIAAKKAGKHIRDNAGKDDLEIDKKQTGASLASQVVTEVDRMAQDIILKCIEPTLKEYDLGLLAEESDDDLSRFKKDYFWSIDPMDGTLPFIESRAGYAVSIGLVSRQGVPIIGVVNDPREQVLYHAIKGVGCFRNEERWSPNLSSDKPFVELDRGGAVMNACWVLENAPSYFHKMPKPQNGGGCVWDYAATACIFETIGAWVSDMQGNPLDLNRREAPFMNHKGVLFASHKSILEKFNI